MLVIISEPASDAPASTPRSENRWRTAAIVLLFLLGAGLFVGFGLLGIDGHLRCTTEYAVPDPRTAPLVQPTGPTSGGAGAAGLTPVKQTCSPLALTDPPLVVVGIVFLLLAVPALGISQLGFGGLTLTRAVAGAADAARSASEAADRASTALANLVAVHSTTQSAALAAGNSLTVYTGNPRDSDFASVETAAAFTLAANGVTEAVLNVSDYITAAVLLWRDPATDSLRPALRAQDRRGIETLSGMDMRSKLGEVTRRGLAVPVTIERAEDARLLGLPDVVTVPVSGVAIPTARPGRPPVGLVLALVDTEGLDTPAAEERTRQVIASVAPFALPAAVLIERLTTARSLGIL